AEEVTEHVAEDVGEACVTTEAGPTAHLRIDTSVAVLIISAALTGIGKNFISLIGFFEFLFRVMVVRIAVGVVLHRQTSVSLFQLGLTGTALHAQYFVIVSFCHFSRIPLTPLQTRQRGSRLPRGVSRTHDPRGRAW